MHCLVSYGPCTPSMIKSAYWRVMDSHPPGFATLDEVRPRTLFEEQDHIK